MALRKRDKKVKNVTPVEVPPVAPQNRDFTESELKDLITELIFEHSCLDLRTAFGLLDRNCDGHVTVSELQFMLQNMGIDFSDEVIHDLVSEASHSGENLIDETEFLQWVTRIQALRIEEGVDEVEDTTRDLVAAFRVFDRDGNGYITKDELKTAMDIIGESVTEEELNEMLAIADIDKDGKINYEEFARMLL